MTPTKLYCEDELVGKLADPFFTDLTWFATIAFVTDADNPLAARIREYKAFCEDWNERTSADPMNGPDAAEFDAFDDIVRHKQWFVETKVGVRHPIDMAPVFWAENELSWRP